MRRIAAALAIVFLIGGAAPSPAVTSLQDAKCRRGLLYAERRLTYHLVRQLGDCHVRRAKGRLPFDVDCNDLSSLPYPQIISRIERSVHQLAKSQCRRAAPPSALGFDICMEPCEHIVADTYRDVADCLICNARVESLETVEFALGTPPVTGPHTEQTKCVDYIATALRKYLDTRLLQSRQCQYLHDRGRLREDVDCHADDFRGNITRARNMATSYFARCRVSSRSRLGVCGNGTLEETVDCFQNGVEDSTEVLFDEVYSP